MLTKDGGAQSPYDVDSNSFIAADSILPELQHDVQFRNHRQSDRVESIPLLCRERAWPPPRAAHGITKPEHHHLLRWEECLFFHEFWRDGYEACNDYRRLSLQSVVTRTTAISISMKTSLHLAALLVRLLVKPMATLTILGQLFHLMAETDIRTGLIAYWPMDGHLNDVVQDHDGTARGVIPLEYVGLPGLGRAVRLDGVSQFIEITGGVEDDFDFESESMSVAIWFVMDSGKTAQTLIGKGASTSWRLAQSGTDRVLSFGGVQAKSLKGPKFRKWGELHHAVAIADQENGETRLYIDGELVSKKGPPRSRNGEARLLIGMHPENRNRIWKGIVDDVAIWNRALSAADVDALWNDGNALPLGSHLPDSDQDGLPDFWEEANGFSPEEESAEIDADADGSTNLQEFLAGTDPKNPDTDADGLPDGVETGTGVWRGSQDTGTSPHDPDSDGDFLRDGTENPDLPNSGPSQTGTDPNLADSNKDGSPDRADVTLGPDPEFRIEEVTAQNGLIHIAVPSRSDSYYVLLRKESLENSGRPVEVLVGTGSRLTFTDRMIGGGSVFYAVRRYLLMVPDDLDQDGFDDVTELKFPGYYSPLNAARFVVPEDGSVMISDVAQFDSFSVASARGLDAASGTTQQPRIIKLVVSLRSRRQPATWFVNTTRHAVHESFKERSGVSCVGNCVHSEVIQYPGLQLPDGSIGLYTVRLDGVTSLPTVETVFEHVEINMPVAKGRLALHVTKQDQRWYERNVARFRKAGIPVVLDDDLLGDNAYVGLNHAEAFGRLRVIEAGERPLLTDIALFRTIPNDIPHIAGIITELPQTPLSHVNLRAVQNNAPNAYIRDATITPEIRGLIGKNVYYKVTGAGFEIREASQEELDTFFDGIRPKEPQIPVRNIGVTEFRDFDDMVFADSDAFGVKAANLAELRKVESLGDGTVPDGFAVPFHFYDEFMRHNDLYDRARKLIAVPSFRQSPDVRDIALKSFRKEIRSGIMPLWMFNAVTQLQAKFEQGVSIRCRSSTNNEDLPGFNGAGLYDSFTHHPDEGHLSKSIKQVFASLWNLRAFEEREFYRIDHFEAAMGVLIHPNFSNERVNGVAVTKNILFGAGLTGSNTYYVNAQIGEELVTNPEGAALPEEILTSPDGTEITYLRASNRVPENSKVLSRSKIRRLARDLHAIRIHFRKLYGAGTTFAMEIEFKVDENDAIVIKQARPWVE